MKIYPECIPCTYKVCLSALNAAGLEDTTKIKALGKLGEYISSRETDTVPGVYHSDALHFINSFTGIADPFMDAKRESNSVALKCTDHLVGLIQSSDDPLRMALKVSAAGNIIDMGIMPDYDLDTEIDKIPDNEFYIDSYSEFRELALSRRNMLIIGDNSGEIAFDVLLVRELQKLGIEVTYAVKSGPVLNDATIEDAVQVGMTGICKVITSGSSLLGTDLKSCSGQFADGFRKAGVIISKGQANYESLEGSAAAGDKTFFVLRIKCECVAENAGAPTGSSVFMRNCIR